MERNADYEYVQTYGGSNLAYRTNVDFITMTGICGVSNNVDLYLNSKSLDHGLL
jgi:hypothetical protein